MNRADKIARNRAKTHPITQSKYLRVQLESVTANNKIPFWVQVRFITERTGWTRSELRRARVQGTIHYKKIDGTIYYDIHSLPEIFFIR